ncbi:thiamine-phosphate kinase [Archaeoglobus sulfaticallidus PM70-1]|uniref:Thiamine-monophosphate kinase n=1 Tax=Archaeoglobus sulfaticallidus PM70-1 TaxID=387631 RepID=N0BEM4_9EURY|nr:thiamine-phosphate kinase [Archaeoglobus sulfaticallidus]AGK61458.1 thiamine-phosphate kinase [Archaeoglobus sulfaticallidus PM70-1]
MKEFEFIAIARDLFKSRKKEVVYGAGDDDCAVIKLNDRYLVLSSDMLHEQSDFPKIMTPFEIGWMSVAVNFSDLAGSGVKPEYFIFDICLREGIEDSFEEILKGVKALCDRYDAEVVGGDVDFGDELFIVGFALGFSDRVVVQSGAKAGDRVYITGLTGKSQLALEYYLKGYDREEIPFVSSLVMPEPKVKEGLMLTHTANSMTDISDSLAVSLHNIASRSNVCIEIEAMDLSELLEFVDYDKALELFLYGGGDFELVFTSDSEPEVGIEIGRVREGKGVHILDDIKRTVEFRGYSHF